ncbi:MAG: peptidoglycan recognition family protein [Oscillospiraceae bacterium]|nr:peptidoglycan recognition family protein [Oscillospiraceae bacterium]
MILRADKVTNLGGVKVNEYLLTAHNSRNIAMPSDSMEGRVIGVTIHNTDWITVAEGTTPAEQYTRATVNGNMNDVRVHFYVDDTCAWQNLPLSLSGWHAADQDGDGNRRTIAIECIMGRDYTDRDKKSEDNAARLAATLLRQYGFGIDRLYTHQHWYSGKYCPAYILPHWEDFKKKAEGYLNAGKPQPKPEVKKLYRVRKTRDDAKSQIGAYSVLENAKKACPRGYEVFDEQGSVVFSNVLKYGKGEKVYLAGAKLYASADSKTEVRTITGEYFLYDGKKLNGRYRVTVKQEYCGNTPAGKYVTGYVDKNEMR